MRKTAGFWWLGLNLLCFLEAHREKARLSITLSLSSHFYLPNRRISKPVNCAHLLRNEKAVACGALRQPGSHIRSGMRKEKLPPSSAPRLLQPARGGVRPWAAAGTERDCPAQKMSVNCMSIIHNNTLQIHFGNSETHFESLFILWHITFHLIIYKSMVEIIMLKYLLPTEQYSYYMICAAQKIV